MRFFFSSAEASGDAYAGEIARRIRDLDADAELEGIGGQKFAAAGGKRVANSTSWGAIGVGAAIPIFFSALSGMKRAKRALRSGRPGVFIPIDSGFLNIRLARHAKSAGWKVLYFCPPGAWRKDRQGEDLASITDAVATPFPWSADILKGTGANARWVGHPVKQMIAETPHGDSERERIAILPGSRSMELQLLLPLFAETVRDFDRVCEFAVSPVISPEELRSRWLRLVPQRTSDIFTAGDPYGVLHRARAGLICSGTATLEAALCRCPMAVVYKLDFITEVQARLARVKFDFISQPNILLGKAVVPEMIQREATPAAIRKVLEPLLADSNERATQLAEFVKLDALLGSADALDQTAKWAVELATSMDGAALERHAGVVAD